MSERGRGRGGSQSAGGASSSRGGSGGRGGGGGGGAGRGGRGGGRGGSTSASGHSTNSTAERPKKDPILDLNKYMDKKIRVKFAGGREVFGVLKGFDQLMNLVMDEVDESLRDQDGNVTEKTRPLGLVVVRGTALTVINPADGYESIENPFAQAE